MCLQIVQVDNGASASDEGRMLVDMLNMLKSNSPLNMFVLGKAGQTTGRTSFTQRFETYQGICSNQVVEQRTWILYSFQRYTSFYTATVI